jgi:5-methylcytosine-specific restriction endonuclease McrA
MARPDADGNIACTGCNRSLPGTIKYFHRHRDAFKPKCKECRGSSFGVHDPNRVMDVPEGEKICATCRRTLPADAEHFYKNQKTSGGRSSQCKECHGGRDGAFGVQHPNKALDIPEGYWFCSMCEQVLPLNGRYFYESRSKGFEIYCQACSVQRRNQSRRAARKKADDELTPREWMFIKAMWLNGGVVECAYCGESTQNPERDHVQPLCDGGGTVVENIVPACPPCNRSKGHKTVTEWYPNADTFDPDRWERIQSHLRGDTRIPS